MSVRRPVLALLILLAFGGATCQAAPFTNGSFELGIPLSGEYSTLYSPDMTSIAGWVVSGGSIDYINTLWNAADGSRSLDLNGYMALGTIEQTFTTVPNQLYRVVFWMSGNPDGGPRTTSLQVSAAGASQIFNYVVPSLIETQENGGRHYDITWEQKVWDFMATGPSTTLAFTSLDYTEQGRCGPGYSYGPALDNVSVSEIPEPGTFGLAGLALLTIGWLRRRA